MSFAPLYLLNRLFFRISDFFHHWYIDGSRAILHRCTSVFESLDQTFALRITLRYFWKPLYGDYSIVGRIFGVIMLAFSLLWLILPFAILFGAYRAYLTTGP